MPFPHRWLHGIATQETFCPVILAQKPLARHERRQQTSQTIKYSHVGQSLDIFVVVQTRKSSIRVRRENRVAPTTKMKNKTKKNSNSHEDYNNNNNKQRTTYNTNDSDNDNRNKNNNKNKTTRTRTKALWPLRSWAKCLEKTLATKRKKASKRNRRK